MNAAVISEKGVRPSMEDAHILDVNFGQKGWVYGGIYDGHNGDFAARYAEKRLPDIFLKNLFDGFSPVTAFTRSYEIVSQEIGGQDSGTTAVDFLIQPNRVSVANAGDARAIVVGRQRISQLTVDHRVENLEERQRVIKMGAIIDYPYVVKDSQGIMPTRTIGDRYFKSVGVIALPSVNEYVITPDDLMLVSACDGLWDFMSNVEVADLAREYKDSKTFLDKLEREVLIDRRGTDNLTVIAVSLSE